MTTFNEFTFSKTDNNSTVTLDLKADGCQEVVDGFISFMRGCSYMDVSIYAAMANAVEEYDSYANSLKNSVESGLHEPIGK
jgi:hypothetical protein